MEYGATIQPYIILVDKNIFSIDTCYIRINYQLWIIQCPLHAVNICFKTYFAFHWSYPREYHKTWLLLQTEMFHLNIVL